MLFLLLVISPSVYSLSQLDPPNTLEVRNSTNSILSFRYRFAALPSRFGRTPSQDPRLRPRTQHKLFHGTSLLVKDRLKFQGLLNTWYGSEEQEWRLLFKASRDGFSAAAFHSNCDGHAPTFTLVQVDRVP